MDNKLARTTYDCKTAAAILRIPMAEMRRLAMRHGIEKAAEARGPLHSPRYLPRQIIELRKCLWLRHPADHKPPDYNPLYIGREVKSPGVVSMIIKGRSRALWLEWEARSMGQPCDACTMRCALGSLRVRDMGKSTGVYFPSRYEDKMMLCRSCANDYEEWKASRRPDGTDLSEPGSGPKAKAGKGSNNGLSADSGVGGGVLPLYHGISSVLAQADEPGGMA